MLARTKLGLAVVLSLFGCGDDEGAGGQRPNQAQVAAAQAKADEKNKLVPRKHVEDNVSCPVPEKPTGPQCEPLSTGTGTGSGSAAAAAPAKMLADCEPGLYCIQVGAGFNCEPCPVRDTIRHDFKERDFITDQARDPFLNYVIMPTGLTNNSSSDKPEPHQSCKRKDQFVAGNYSYVDLKLVGIVAQGAQRKALMIDTAGQGHIIKRGDCVGKEKAVVKDIGAAFMLFVVEEDPDNKRPAESHPVQLHPNAIDVDSSTGAQVAPDTTAPIVAPPAAPKGAAPGTVPLTAPPVAPPVVLPPAKK